MKDVVTLEFERLKNEGNLVFSPMYMQTLIYESRPVILGINADLATIGPASGSWILQADMLPFSQGSMKSLSFDDMSDYIYAEFGSYRDLAVAQAFANVDQTDLLALASLGEAPESVAYIATLFRRLITLLRSFISRKTKLRLLREMKKLSPSEYADALSNLWLELRYALRPMVSEFSSALEAFKRELDREQRYTARGFHEVTTTSSETADFTELSNFVEGDIEVDVKYEARAGVLYTISVDTQSITTILGLDRPLESLWELVPGSFILDWIFNIGDILATWEQNASLIIQQSWVVETITVEKTYEATGVTPGAAWSSYTSLDIQLEDTGLTKAIWVVKCRTLTPDKPTFPGISVNLDVSKIIDLAAIARGLWKAIRS